MAAHTVVNDEPAGTEELTQNGTYQSGTPE